PGERVVARLTETRHEKPWRADVHEVLEPSAQRVPTVWPEAGPGGVGGGEVGHESLAGQLAWKRSVIDDALARIARLPQSHPVRPDLMVQHPPGEGERGGTSYRTRGSADADGPSRARRAG